MELVRPYLEGENDTWNPLRGTGLYELRQEVDVQDTWTAFSHRSGLTEVCHQFGTCVFPPAFIYAWAPSHVLILPLPHHESRVHAYEFNEYD